MGKFRFVMIGIGVILIAAQLALFDYQNWNWSENWGGLAAIAAVILAVVSMILANHQEKKPRTEESP